MKRLCLGFWPGLAFLAAVAMERGGAHIPGYTGYTPGIRETIGLSFSEASRESIERLMSTEDFAPQIPLEGERPDSVWKFDHRGDKKSRSKYGFVPAQRKSEEEQPEGSQIYFPEPHAQVPWGVDPAQTKLGKMTYETTSKMGAGRFQANAEKNIGPPRSLDGSPDSMAKRIAARRLDRERNAGGRIYRQDEYGKPDVSYSDGYTGRCPKPKVGRNGW